MSGHIESVLELVRGGLRAGEPRSHGGLTLVPLFGGRPAGEYLVGSEAFEAGLLAVTELGEETVPEILADNRANVPVLLLEGEHLQGARQDRVLNVSVLLAAGRTMLIPVSCVEHGRWHYGEQAGFGPADAPFAPVGLRARKTADTAVSARAGARYRADQSAVWEEVAAVEGRLAATPSATGALGDAVRGRRSDLEGMLSSFPAPGEGQTGVVACIGGRPVAADAFDRPETLGKVWSRLIGGYATDAIGVPAAAVPNGSVERFLAEAAGGQTTSHEGVGLGMQVIATSTVVATALTWDDGVVHLAVLGRPGQPGVGRSFASPQMRARRWFHDRG